ncbi:MAG: phosphoglycerate kinase [Candidatus Fonsibacter sp.]|jgi:phosphoglycerate kinase|nr:phosphoglycerate kinase [Candidatus Fonsibacter sp.]
MNNLNTLPGNEDIKDKIIFLKVDFNIPIKDGKVIDDTKIVKMKEIINKLLSRKTKIILCSHLGRPQKYGNEGLSLEQVKNRLENIFKKDIVFLNNYLNKETKDNIKKSNKELFLLENIRFHKEEENNDSEFAKQLASIADIYINEAFSCSHRAHASVTGITKFIRSYAGETIINELDSLEKIFNKSNRPVTCIIGGSKISTKIDLISNLIKKVDFMIIGGAMANNFIKYNNFKIGKSLFEPHKEEIIKEIISTAHENNCKLIIPEDVIVSANENIAGKNKSLSEIESNDIIFDIGANTIKNIGKIINSSKTLLWNGPLGFFERDFFASGSNEIAKLIKINTQKKLLISIAGGGDTAAAIKKAKAEDGFSYISTAGGAFLEWLEGKILPGLKVLEK